MALPWQWILEKLAREPETSIGALQEISSYVPNASRKQYVQKALALRQLQEMLVSEDEDFDSTHTAECISTLGSSSDEDLLRKVRNSSFLQFREELFRFVQRKKANLETPVLDKIACDHANGLYPSKLHSENVRQDENVTSRSNQKPAARHLSVASDATTVVINGADDATKENDPNVVNSHEKRPYEDTFIDSCKRICRDLGTKLFKQKEHEAQQPVPVDNSEDVPDPEGIPQEASFEEQVKNVSTRRSRRKMSIEDSEDEECQVQKMVQRVEVIDLVDVEDMESEDNNAETCCKCNKHGNLVRCEGCPISIHEKCLGTNSPEGDWFCPKCVYKQALERLSRAKEEAEKAKIELERFMGKRISENPVKREAGEVMHKDKVVHKDEVMHSTEVRQGKKAQGSDYESSECGSEESEPSPKKKTGREMIPHQRRKKMAWSTLEEEALREGYAKFGTKWQKILQFGMGKFHPTRTGIDLKDKWRNMKKKEH